NRRDYAIRLPSEVLVDIIFDLISSHFPDPDPCVAAKTLSHVCARWRAIALASKKLWAYIPVQLGEEWVRLALGRSDTYPISFNDFSGTTRW
ncbi:hypothetical protein K488DRAFT_56159, partial [Vararia minispora EC-137]